MKLRLKGNSIRFRLTKSDVDLFSKNGLIKEQLDFSPEPFIYIVKADNTVSELIAEFKNNTIALAVPETLLKDWAETDRVGIEGNMKTEGGHTIYLLIEKDFKCLEKTIEDQSDNFENPNCNE